MNIIRLADVKLVQAWIEDLLSVGYEFPPLVRGAAAAPYGLQS